MINDVSCVLVLAPHTDDGELGCGGFINRMVESGTKVFYAAFSTADKSLPPGMPPDTLRHEVIKATAAIGIPADRVIIKDYEVRKLNYSRQEILEELIALRKDINPDLVLMPSMYDIHQDHTTISQEGLRAFKTTKLLGYELIWNNLTFDTTMFVKLEARHVAAKCAALEAYRSQSGRDYMTADFIESLARTRGVQIGVAYAEAYEVIRWII